MSPARHPSPLGRSTLLARVGGGVNPDAGRVYTAPEVGCGATRQRGHGWRVGDTPCLDSRALRERGQRCLHGRDHARAATYYAAAEYAVLVETGITPETTELAILADYCLTQAARTQR